MISFLEFSPQQRRVLTWWTKTSPHRAKAGVLCDGAVRSGKTMCLSLSFVLWAMAAFQQQAFALCGKTVPSLRRNLVVPLLHTLSGLGFACREQISKGYVEVSAQGIQNRFYLFGGVDERAAALIQGVTLAGVLLDEAALLPQSFVEQALARCSVPGSKFWFSCNPEYPGHWFYREYIQKAEEKELLYLHFTMEDNPSLTPEIRQRYERLYSGSFYERFVLGRWTGAAGAVYPMFSRRHIVDGPLPVCQKYYVSCDYGTVNPASFGLWGQDGDRWIRCREYYYDSKQTGELKTDQEYYKELEKLCEDLPIAGVIVDPSAASFLEVIRRHGKYGAIKADNDVLQGIRRVSVLLKEDRLLFSRECRDILREFSLYCWEEGTADRPRKQYDHAMDEMRYFVNTVLGKEEEGCCALSASRPAESLGDWKRGIFNKNKGAKGRSLRIGRP